MCCRDKEREGRGLGDAKLLADNNWQDPANAAGREIFAACRKFLRRESYSVLPTVPGSVTVERVGCGLPSTGAEGEPKTVQFTLKISSRGLAVKCEHALEPSEGGG